MFTSYDLSARPSGLPEGAPKGGLYNILLVSGYTAVNGHGRSFTSATVKVVDKANAAFGYEWPFDLKAEVSYSAGDRRWNWYPEVMTETGSEPEVWAESVSIVNLTPHPVRLLDEGGSLLVEYASSGMARANQHDTVVDRVELNGKVEIEIVESTFGDLSGLPDPVPGTKLVVSAIVAQAARTAGRTTSDLLLPSGLVRDTTTGQVIGCRRFARLPAN